jgi:hypothetical protein
MAFLLDSDFFSKAPGGPFVLVVASSCVFRVGRTGDEMPRYICNLPNWTSLSTRKINFTSCCSNIFVSDGRVLTHCDRQPQRDKKDSRKSPNKEAQISGRREAPLTAPWELGRSVTAAAAFWIRIAKPRAAMDQEMREGGRGRVCMCVAWRGTEMRYPPRHKTDRAIGHRRNNKARGENRAAMA